MNSTAEKLLTFIKESPTAFQAVEMMKKRFGENGFTELKEDEHWELVNGGKYFVTRNHSAVIAFTVPEASSDVFHIIASHSDSPSLKIKENPEMVENGYVKLNVELYGGALLAPWFDRPLSVAGRVIVKENGQICEKLVTVDKDMLMIPNLAIHMNREANSGYKYNVQKDLLPLYGLESAKGTFFKTVAEAAGVAEEEILGHDLFLYNRMPGTIWGGEEEFVSAPRLDDLQCAFSSMEGLIAGKNEKSICVHMVMDNEEVGSGTKQGAASGFLKDTLARIADGLGKDAEDFRMMLSESFMISADNAHAAHPNHLDKADPTNRPYMNEGIVIKYNANQRYTTDAVSAAVFQEICRRAEVPVQSYVNRSDVPGGSTLGNIASHQVSINMVDIGLAQLAMHSPYETAGVKDTSYLIRALREFYSTKISRCGDEKYQLL